MQKGLRMAFPIIQVPTNPGSTMERFVAILMLVNSSPCTC